ncbi:hypothetical protein L210DRAFT_3500335 [Boletus edulis BED1]|uniref:Uncharacterized protein n=1 Tax=Boletus edulis BED1 TaxID=1328754 RepID=A0AAD4C7V2_BOLED|nr:hypothetical protein L210DRAFT_3500335 [Boletus edulis BED1]
MSFLSKGEFNSEPEGKEERAEMCQWHELHRSATERGAMEHPEFEADATKENGGGCNEPEDVPILPAERDRESLEGCLRVTEWWSNSRSCHRMSEDAAETGSEEVRRWAVKRTGHEGVEIVASGVLIPLLGSGAKIGRMQSGAHAIWGKSGVKWIRLEWHTRSGGDPRKEDSMERARKRICEEKRNKEEPSWGDLIHKENAPELVGSEMDGAVMEQYWRRSGGLEVREVGLAVPMTICIKNPMRVNQNGSEVVFAIGGKVLEVRRLKGKSEMKVIQRVNGDDSDERSLHEGWTGICQEVSNGREGRWSVTEDARRHEGREMKTTTKSSKSGVPLEVQRTQRRRQWNRKGLQRSTKGGTDGDYHEVTRSGVP